MAFELGQDLRLVQEEFKFLHHLGVCEDYAELVGNVMAKVGAAQSPAAVGDGNGIYLPLFAQGFLGGFQGHQDGSVYAGESAVFHHAFHSNIYGSLRQEEAQRVADFGVQGVYGLLVHQHAAGRQGVEGEGLAGEEGELAEPFEGAGVRRHDARLTLGKGGSKVQRGSGF